MPDEELKEAVKKLEAYVEREEERQRDLIERVTKAAAGTGDEDGDGYKFDPRGKLARGIGEFDDPAGVRRRRRRMAADEGGDDDPA